MSNFSHLNKCNNTRKLHQRNKIRDKMLNKNCNITLTLEFMFE